MKKTITIVLVVVAMTLIITSVALAGRKKGFDGAWESIDLDDSYQIMVIQTSDDYYMYYDFGASICGFDENGDPIHPCVLEGIPSVEGNVLSIAGKVLCITDSPFYVSEGGTPTVYDFDFTYNRQRDTIEGMNVTWNRIGKE